MRLDVLPVSRSDTWGGGGGECTHTSSSGSMVIVDDDVCVWLII